MATNFKINQVFQVPNSSSATAHIFRVLGLHVIANYMWIIEIDFKNEYCKGPMKVSLSDYEEKLKSHLISFTTYVGPPIWYQSDDEIKKQYYTKKSQSCAPILLRETRWALIEGLVEQHPIIDILDGKLLGDHFKTISSGNRKITVKKVYHAFHSYCAAGFNKNVLLGGWYRSGARGVQKIQKTKLGRPNAYIRKNKLPNDGYHLSNEDKEKMQFAWKEFTPDSSREEAYLKMCATFYDDGVHDVHGETVHKLKPVKNRPTDNQFYTWGPRGESNLPAWKSKLSDREIFNDHRGYIGSSSDGIRAFGQAAYCDTTSNDVVLLSIDGQERVVGTANRLVIKDAKTQIIMGMHVGFESPSAETFLKAVFNAATDKVAYYKRYGLDISHQEAPPMSSQLYIGDNGEYRSSKAKTALAHFGAQIELTRSGAAVSKAPIEANHHMIHSRLDHRLDGTTHGRQKKRGEKKAADNATFTYYDYMHELLKEVHYYNNIENVGHLRSVEMIQDNVAPTRMAIYRWHVEKGYSVSFEPDINSLRAHLLPEIPAVLTESGIFLVKQNSNVKYEVIKSLRYVSPYLITSGLLEDARRTGNKRLSLRGLPEDPTTMFLITSHGIEQLHWENPDPILRQKATIVDCIDLQENIKIERLKDSQKIDQNRSDIIQSRENKKDKARARKKEISKNKNLETPTKSDVSSVRENRKKETDLLRRESGDSKPIKESGTLRHSPPDEETSSEFEHTSKTAAEIAIAAFLRKD